MRERLSQVCAVAAVVVLALGVSGCLTDGAKKATVAPRLLLELPEDCNTPDGCTLADNGDIILSIPNFNNDALIKRGDIKEPSPAKMVKISPDNKLSDWYKFKKEELHPDTGKVGPMGCDFGPDGHLYVADNQLFYDGNNKSRLIRIKCKDGKPVSCDPVVEGFIVSNAVIWHGDTVYVSETILQHTKAEEGKPKPKLVSGVYAIKIDEWKDGPVKLKPYTPESPDPHLIAVYETSNSTGFGADGLTFDAEGNMYCGIFEDGIVYKTTFKGDGTVLQQEEFAKAPCMACCDGIFWRKADNRIYVSDMLQNAVQIVDMKGKVTTLHTNPDTDGAGGLLDQPCEVLVRGNELIVINMDMPWESDTLFNKKIDRPYTVSVIPLP